MSLKLEPGVRVILYLKPDAYGGGKERYGTIVHISATTILLELTLDFNIDEGEVLNGNYNYRFDEIIRIDPN